MHGAARAGLALAGAIWLLAPLAHAGALEGKVVHDGKGSLKGLPINVVFRAKDGSFDRTSTTTTADGRFRVDGLTETGPHLVFVEYKDITYPPEMVELDKPDATGQVQLEVFDESDDGSKLRISRIQTVVGRGEAGVFRIQHLIALENTGRSVLRRAKDAPPLARFGLLPNRTEGELAASLGFNPADVVAGADGSAEFRGPIFPGEQMLNVSYEVDAGGRDLLTEIAFPEAVQEFELYVRDEGMAIYAQPLHPAQLHVEREQGKPVPYQKYLGFDIAAGTRVPLRLETLPEPGTSELLAAALVAVLFGMLAVFVGFPVAEGARGTRREREVEADTGPPEALLAALADLEHDFEMGKISEGDRERMREELRREAVQAMALQRAEKARAPRPPPSTPAIRVCSCGQEASSEARFCSACGRKL
jgi:hypothetical protein